MEYQNINDSLLQSFKNIMCQQEKMDNKAYIFIGFLAIILNALNMNIPFSWNRLNISIFYLFIPLVISLFPIATKLLINLIPAGSYIPQDSHNIFYYLDIYKLPPERFYHVLKDEYDISTLSKSDKMLIAQILINAKILHHKVWWHNTFIFSLIVTTIIQSVKINP